jgi:hypothetical protein
LAEIYGSGVVTEYVDVFSEQMKQHEAARRVISRGNVLLPVVGINGTPRFAGGIAVDLVCEELDKLGLPRIEQVVR